MTNKDDARAPVTTPEELARFDDDEILDGYRDGLKNEPCGGNRSKAYWHGWRNGMVDGKHATKDGAQAMLAASIVKNQERPR